MLYIIVPLVSLLRPTIVEFYQASHEHSTVDLYQLIRGDIERLMLDLKSQAQAGKSLTFGSLYPKH